MTYIITKLSHPLDAVWAAAIEALHDAQSAIDALPEDFEDEQLNELGEAFSRELMTLMALPVRNLEDSLYKLRMADVGDGSPRTDCNIPSILDEAEACLAAALAKGRA